MPQQRSLDVGNEIPDTNGTLYRIVADRRKAGPDESSLGTDYPPIIAMCLGVNILGSGLVGDSGEIVQYYADGVAASLPFQLPGKANLNLVIPDVPPHDWDPNFELEIDKEYRTRQGFKVKVEQRTDIYQYEVAIAEGPNKGWWEASAVYYPNDIVTIMEFVSGQGNQVRRFIALESTQNVNPIENSKWLPYTSGSYKYRVWVTGKIGTGKLPKDVIEPWFVRNFWKYVYADRTDCLDTSKWSAYIEQAPKRPWPSGKSLFQVHMRELQSVNQQFKLIKELD